MTRFLFIFNLLVFSHASAFANQAQQMFKDANEAFQAKEYEKSIGLYNQLLEMGYQSAELEYNLGNAHYRQQRMGQAILHYERALLLSPNDADIQHNLNIARAKTVDEFQALPPFFFTGFWNKMRLQMSATGWGILALVCWWAGMAGLGFWLFGRTRPQKKKGFLFGLIALIISLLPFSLALSRANIEQDSRQAIVLATSTHLRSAPDANSTKLTPIHEGLKVTLLDELSGWWQVQLPNGEKGWMEGEEVEGI